MHLEFSQEEEQFRAEIRELVRSNLPAEWRGWMPFLESDENFEFTRRFSRLLGEKGLLTLAWPEEYGGSGMDVWRQTIFREEMYIHGEPRGPQYMSLNYIGPAIMMAGTSEQKADFLPRISRGEILFCQGFSEPDAGTDLASLKTRAERDGDEYVINGQKIWTSYAHRADYCFLLARTDPDAPRHKGISLFIVPMTTPGITVREIRGMRGWGDICEVFFDDVRIPLSTRLGEENSGWTVAMSALDYERIGVARWAKLKETLTKLVDFVNRPLPGGRRLADEPSVRQKIAEMEIAYRAARLLNYRVVDRMERGVLASWDVSLARMHSIVTGQRLARVAMEILGHYSRSREPVRPERSASVFEEFWRGQITATITAGTLETQKNIIATRGLGLPRS